MGEIICQLNEQVKSIKFNNNHDPLHTQEEKNTYIQYLDALE